MAAYEFICNKCGDFQSRFFPAKEYDEETLKEKPCLVDGCRGVYEQSFERTQVGHSWKGGPPTPRLS